MHFAQLQIHNFIVAIQIVGFSVAGRVLDSPNGTPVVGAKVIVNNKPVAVTDGRGAYILEKIKAGHITVNVEADNLEFAETVVKVDPNVESLPDIIPSKYLVCGTVVSDTSRTVTINQVGSSESFTVNIDPNNGKFCKFLAPGTYELLVKVSEKDQEQGAQ